MKFLDNYVVSLLVSTSLGASAVNIILAQQWLAIKIYCLIGLTIAFIQLSRVSALKANIILLERLKRDLIQITGK